MFAVIVALLVRLLIGGLLTLAGAGKLIAGSRQRQKWLRAYGLVPAALLPPVATAVPTVELLSGTALLLGFGGRISVGFGGGVLSLITAAAWITLARGKRPDCGCFGRWARDQLSWNIVMRNAVLLGLLALMGALDITQPAISAFPLPTQLALVAALSVIVVIGPPAFARLRRARQPIDGLTTAVTQA